MYDRPQYNPNQFNQFNNIDMNNLMGWQTLTNHAIPQNHNIVYTKQNWVQTIQVNVSFSSPETKNFIFRKRRWKRLY